MKGIAEIMNAGQADVCGNDLTCSVVREEVDAEGCARYTTYGMKVRDAAGDTRLFISDISTCKKFVESFAHTCERHEISLCHVMEVLDDSLP